MNAANHKQWVGLWGIVIGGSLGFMESAIGIRLWHEFGSPDFLFRRRLLDLHLHIIMNTMAGIVLGLVFGSIVDAMSKRRALSIRIFPIYIILMSLGFLLFAGQYWVTLKCEIPLWFAGDAILFVGGLLLAPGFMRKEDAQLTGAPSSESEPSASSETVT
ncbi:MAG: hypothetical protein AMJ65_08850 [Phycisphaerae bacterium SG8_4]|nr:MAG: hypothetical protein AMJ65_08850 [Phycisphaerae bacterium SG8_4]